MIKHIYQIDCYEILNDNKMRKVETVIATNAIDAEVKAKLARIKYDVVYVKSKILDIEEDFFRRGVKYE